MSATVFDLPIAKASAWIFNSYIVETAAGLVVVDPGLPVVARQAIEVIERDLERQVSDIVSINCTHGHPDHVAGVSTLTGQTTCDVVLPARCESYLAGEKPRVFPVVESSVRFMPVWSGQKFSPRAAMEFARYGTSTGFGGPPMMTLDFEPSGFVADGDALPKAEGWEVIEAPGHTDDSTCFYHAATETLISGDAVVTHDGRAWFNPEYVDPSLAEETEERLRSLKVSHLLPGHGEPIEDADVWRRALSFRSKPTGNGALARCSRRFGKW